MDTKELLDRLRCPGIDACPLAQTRTTCTECQKTVKKEAAEVIEKLSNGAGWISVEERLPEIGRKCLIANSEIVVRGWLRPDGVWKTGVSSDEIWRKFSLHPPTHWMPLPEPPKEDMK